MAQEIVNGFIASFILAGFWTVGRVIARINGLLNSRRITARERGIHSKWTEHAGHGS
jgi:hypothetical protein